jgi:hypothetical protein
MVRAPTTTELTRGPTRSMVRVADSPECGIRLVSTHLDHIRSAYEALPGSGHTKGYSLQLCELVLYSNRKFPMILVALDRRPELPIGRGQIHPAGRNFRPEPRPQWGAAAGYSRSLRIRSLKLQSIWRDQSRPRSRRMTTTTRTSPTPPVGA